MPTDAPNPLGDQEILEAAFERIDGGVRPTVAALLAQFPGREESVHRVLTKVERYESEVQRARLARETDEVQEIFGRGSEAGDYLIEEEIGRGGMGVVYRARQRSLEREVALKVLPPERVAHSPSFAQRFRREARLAATVHHPNLAEVYDSGTQGEHLYFAMRLVEGRTLQSVLTGLSAARRRGEANLQGGTYTRRAVELVRGVAAALEAIHRAGFIHRDVKPSNILLEGSDGDELRALDCRPVLVDFGLLRPVEGSDLTGTKTTLLTPDYASPEAKLQQAQSAATDVFSLGAVLFDLLAQTTTQDRAPASSGLPDVRTLNPAVDERLAAIVRLALEERSALRYADGGEFERELRAYLDGEPIQALPASGLGRLRLWARRDPLRAVKAAGVAVVSIAVLLSALVGGRRAVRLYSLASQAREADAVGDLPLASARFADLLADRQLAGWLPGLGDDVDRAEDYRRLLAGEFRLSDACELLDSEEESSWLSAHVLLQRCLLDPEVETDPVPILRFLVRELESAGREGRELLAATTVGQYLMVRPLPFEPRDARGVWAERLEARVLELVESVHGAECPSELQYQALCVASGLGSLDAFRSLAPLVEHGDPETRRLAACATERLWLHSWRTDLVRDPNVSKVVQACWGTLGFALTSVGHDLVRSPLRAWWGGLGERIARQRVPGEFPPGPVAEWCGRLWRSAERVDVAIVVGEFSSGRRRPVELELHAAFEERMGHALLTVAWAMLGSALEEELVGTAEWQGLPVELRRQLVEWRDLLRATVAGSGDAAAARSPVLTRWPRSGAPLTFADAFAKVVASPAKHVHQLSSGTHEYVTYENLWTSAGAAQGLVVRNERISGLSESPEWAEWWSRFLEQLRRNGRIPLGLDSADGSWVASFDVMDSRPRLDGYSMELVVRGLARPGPTESSPELSHYLLFRHPATEFSGLRDDRVHFRCRVPLGASRAVVLVRGQPAIRRVLPHGGRASLRLRTSDGGCLIECESTAKGATVPVFHLGEDALRGKEELELGFEVTSLTNQYWLYGMCVVFQ